MYAQLGQCIAPCTGNISSEEYKSLIGDVLSFLHGSFGDVKRSLEEKMMFASENLLDWEYRGVLFGGVYGKGRETLGLKGQCLHSKAIEFTHPRTNDRLKFESDLPDYFKETIKKISHKTASHREKPVLN